MKHDYETLKEVLEKQLETTYNYLTKEEVEELIDVVNSHIDMEKAS